MGKIIKKEKVMPALGFANSYRSGNHFFAHRMWLVVYVYGNACVGALRHSFTRTLSLIRLVFNAIIQ